MRNLTCMRPTSLKKKKNDSGVIYPLAILGAPRVMFLHSLLCGDGVTLPRGYSLFFVVVTFRCSLVTLLVVCHISYCSIARGVHTAVAWCQVPGTGTWLVCMNCLCVYQTYKRAVPKGAEESSTNNIITSYT